MADLLSNDLVHFEALKAQRQKALKALERAKKIEKTKLKSGYKWIKTEDKIWRLQPPSPSGKRSKS